MDLQQEDKQLNKILSTLCSPAEAVFFDCDGTLSQIEGINYLAELRGVADEVSALTDQAMSQTGLSVDLYQQRLSYVQPHQQDLFQLAKAYYEYASEDVESVIAILQSLDIAVYVISAGNNPAVSKFSLQLNIPESHVLCVDLEFDVLGNYQSFDNTSPLVGEHGKASLIEQLRKEHGWSEVVLVGDGMNDCQARHVVESFIGYGGNFYRNSVKDLSTFYLPHSSMSALLPLILSEEKVKLLSDQGAELYAKGARLLDS